jgi:enolase-phosphatase E1
MTAVARPQAILTDIEGTTTSISFVFDVLFPYARAHLAAFLRTHAAEPAVAEQLAAMNTAVGRELSLDEAGEQLIAWIDADCKVTPLKALQGMIWAAGYRDGDFTGHVYPDAVAKLRAWQAAGIALYVYSSGSVQAQQLLFGYSDAGDLTPLFKGWFDTRVGGKREADAYRHIAQQIGRPAQQILFLSDIVEELDAARAAGMATVRLVRDGQPDAGAKHPEVASFDAIDLPLG